MDCIDLERRFGMYRICYEDPQYAGVRDSWHKIIKCRSGHISPAGGSKLWACTSSRRSTAARALLNEGVPARVIMDGDDGVNAEFDVADYREIFSLMGALKR